MDTPKIFESEYRFCLLLWEHEPINSTQLAALCKEKLGWSKATTYTVIKRLCERGVIKSEDAVVTSLVSKEEVQAAEIDELFSKVYDKNVKDDDAEIDPDAIHPFVLPGDHWLLGRHHMLCGDATSEIPEPPEFAFDVTMFPGRNLFFEIMD